MFVTSFIPLWLSIAVVDLWDVVLTIVENCDGQGKFIDTLLVGLRECNIQLISIVIIVVLVLVSVRGINSFLKEKLTESEGRPKGIIEKATKAKKLSSEFLLAYILPMIAFDFGNLKYLVLFIIYYSVLAFLCIRNNNIYTNIFLEVKGYHIYVCDLTCKVMDTYHTYHDSIVISKTDLTQEEHNEISYWDFENYIYITTDKGRKK